MRPIVVFDTNVLFSHTSWRGNPFQCVELARAGAVEGVTCLEILNELTDKLQVKLSFTPAAGWKRNSVVLKGCALGWRRCKNAGTECQHDVHSAQPSRNRRELDNTLPTGNGTPMDESNLLAHSWEFHRCQLKPVLMRRFAQTIELQSCAGSPSACSKRVARSTRF